MRKSMFAAVAAIIAAQASADPSMLPFMDQKTQESATKFFQCVRDTTFAAGMAHKEVAAADVVSAAAAKCKDWPFIELLMKMEYETDLAHRGIDAPPEQVYVPKFEAWRDEWYKEIAGELSAKRLGL